MLVKFVLEYLLKRQRAKKRMKMKRDLIGGFLSVLILLSTQLLSVAGVNEQFVNQTMVNQEIVVGYLPAVRGDVPGRQGIGISGAVSLAIWRINNRKDILPGVNLKLVWNDTEGDTILGTRIVSEMICNGTAAFFGPEFSCAVEATVAAAWNRTMISYRCADGSVSDKERYPTFARTEAPDAQVVKSVLSLMMYYSWKIFQIIVEDTTTMRYLKVAESLHREANIQEMKPNDIQLYNKEDGAYWFEIVNATKAKTRIYVFIGQQRNLVEMMGTMQSLKMFENGEYLVIYIDMEIYEEKEAFKYIWQLNEFNMETLNCRNISSFEDRTARSLLVVAPRPPNQNIYETFSEDVTAFSHKPPFNFKDSILGFKWKKHVSIYAANLYDSVFLYAEALDTLWKKGNREGNIQELARDGRAIFQSIIQMKTYESITGARISIDANGDSEGNYTVIAYKEYAFTSRAVTCDHYMIPVADFHPPSQENSTLPKIKFISGIDWDQPPADSPKCGFLNEHCPRSSTISRSVLTAGLLGFLLIIVLAMAASLYRKWKIEQEIEGLLWKIDKEELQFQQLFGEHTQSRMSLVSVGSYGQVYCTTAHFKGAVVRVKELKLHKKHVISRQTMKEMRYMREMGHPNINTFYGAVIQPMEISLVYDYCGKGSLSDVVENEDIRLDNSFIASLIHDLIKGMIFLHESDIECHGNLKSSNCVITSRWVLQLTDFGLVELQHVASLGSYDPTGPHPYYQNLLWKAPELLREKGSLTSSSQKGDVYAFAIILYEIYGRRGPYGPNDADPQKIVEEVRSSYISPPCRPDLNFLEECSSQCPEFVVQVMTEAWDECPENRPTFRAIRERLKPLKEGMSSNIVDQMMVMMEKYTNNLEELVNERTVALEHEKKKTEDLLHRMLPMPVAQRLTSGDGIEPETFDMVTIYFSDIVGFTQMSAESTPFQVVNFLNDLYTLFDSIIRGYEVYKVETIGDAYMVVSGCPIREPAHAGHIASMALDLRQAILTYRIAHRPNETLKLRIGMHSGPVCAGVVGLTMPRYCLFGDTVNTSSRMESNGEPLKIHISNECKEALDTLGGYITEERGYVHLKGKGNVLTHWLTSSTEGAIKPKALENLGDLKPLFCRPTSGNVPGFGGNFAEQPSFRRRASPKVAGSVNVSRQGSFCAGTQGSGNPLLTARNSAYYLRRPSFDPALLCISLRNSQPSSSNAQNGNNGSNSAVNRNSPSPNRRPTPSKPNPIKIPSNRRRSGSVSATSTCSEGGTTYDRGKCRPVTECCAVTIEPPSDSSTPVSPNTSPLKTLATKISASEHDIKVQPPSSPVRKKVGFLRRQKKNSLGNSGREFRSLDQIPDERVEGPLIPPILVKTRKLSKSLDIPEDMTQLIEAHKNNGDFNRVGVEEEFYDTSNQPKRRQYYDTSSLDEKLEDFHLLEKSNKENSPVNLYLQQQPFHCQHDAELGDIESFDEDDVGLTMESPEEESRDGIPNSKSNQSQPHRSKNYSPKDNWRKEKRVDGASVKKWFQNILNGNGMTATSQSGTTSPTTMTKSTPVHFASDEESQAKLLERRPFGNDGIQEHESVV